MPHRQTYALARPPGGGRGFRLRVRARRMAGWGLALIACLPCLGGCVPQGATYSFGMSTAEIAGQVEVEESATSGPPLVLVYKYHYKFVEIAPGEVIKHPTASLAAVAPDGSFSISVPIDVVDIEAFFIAPDRLTDLFQFHKQVGIGRIVYRPKLPRMFDWRSHFYTYLVPELEHVIVESRYDLPLQDQATLSAWLTGQRIRLESKRKPPASS